MKLKALALFAETYGAAFHRIEAVAEVDNRMRVVDLTVEAVRQAVFAAKESAAGVYRSKFAVDYDPN